jgi:hypothetical protein
MSNLMQHIDKNDPEFREVMRNCAYDTKLYAKKFIGDQVESDFSILHDKMFDVLDDPDADKVLIVAPRGIGKTTFARIKAMQAITYRRYNFIVYVSSSGDIAMEHTEHIKKTLQTNKYITSIFGPPSIAESNYKESFSKKHWVAYGNVCVMPRGIGQQVRGLNWFSYRPDLVIIDDLENSELVNSDEQRQKLQKWFNTDLLKTKVTFGDKKTKFIYIDTIKHEDSLIYQLMESGNWKTVDTENGVLALCDENFKSYDPNHTTDEELKEIYESHVKAGNADYFYSEYMNIPISLKDAVFKKESFRYFDECGPYLEITDNETNRTKQIIVRNLITVILVDPAKTANMFSADSAIVTVSIDRDSHKIFVRDVYAGKIKPDEMYDKMFDAVLMYNAKFLAVEVTGINEFISQPIKNNMKMRGIYPIFIELKATKNKELRISSALSVPYKQGQIYHNKSNCTALENQLIMHPKSKRKDIIDALANIVQVIEDQEIYYLSSDDDYGKSHDPYVDDNPIINMEELLTI